MKEREFNLHDGKSGSAITVRVTPRSSRNEISEILDDGTLKIHLTAPAVEEKANQALIEFLALVLEVKPPQIEIVAGMMGKDKLITVMNIDRFEVQERVLKFFNAQSPK
jgi:uncharacterized protein (TIGR00251 family)